MNEFLLKLFPIGQRKLIVSLIALATAIILEKYQGGLSENLQQSLIALVAIFTGGNVMEHLSNALKVVKGTKIGQVIEDIIPGDQGLGIEQVQQEQADLASVVNQLDQAATRRFQDLDQKLATQAANTNKLIGIVNTLTERVNGKG